MDLDRVEHQGEAGAALQAVLPAVLVGPERMLELRVQVGPGAGDAVAPSAVYAHVRHDFAGMEVDVDLREGGDFEDFDLGLLSVVDGLRIARFRVPLEAESFISVRYARHQREIGHRVEHLAELGESHGDIVRRELPGAVVPGGREVHVGEGDAIVHPDEQVVVDQRLALLYGQGIFLRLQAGGGEQEQREDEGEGLFHGVRAF